MKIIYLGAKGRRLTHFFGALYLKWEMWIYTKKEKYKTEILNIQWGKWNSFLSN